MRGHANPKPSKEGLQRLRRAAKEAYPDCTVEFCSQGDLGGHRAPRDHTLAFRLVGADGRYHSNVCWLNPEYLKHYTADDIRSLVGASNGRTRGR